MTSCSRVAEELPQEEVIVAVDSCWLGLKFSIDNNVYESMPEVRRLDLLLYDANGMGSIELWNRYEALPDSITLRTAKRAVTAIAIANSPRSFSRAAIERYDSIELLCYEFGEDAPDYPLMSGMCSMEPGSPGQITLAPLVSRVQLCEVSNSMKDYVRLEDPRVYLKNLNSSAEILRFSGFRPTESLERSDPAPLPYDIGIFAQHPMTELFCFPNDSPEPSIGTPWTTLVLECEISGQTCRFPVELEGLERNKTLHIDLNVLSPDQHESHIY